MINKRKHSRYQQTLLAGLCVLFAGLLGLELNRDYNLTASPEKTVPDQFDKEMSAVARTQIMPPVTEYQVILERPLFTDSRRPRTDDGAEEIAPKGNKITRPAVRIVDQSLLSGVVITKDKRIALIQPGKGKRPEKVIAGENYNDWVLDNVQPDSVSLSHGDETKNLDLLVTKSPLTTTRNAAPASGRANPAQEPMQKPAQITAQPPVQATTVTPTDDPNAALENLYKQGEQRDD